MHSKVNSPGAGPHQQVTLRDFRVVERVCAEGRKVECVWIPNLIPTTVINVTNHQGPQGGSVEIAHGIH